MVLTNPIFINFFVEILCLRSPSINMTFVTFCLVQYIEAIGAIFRSFKDIKTFSDLFVSSSFRFEPSARKVVCQLFFSFSKKRAKFKISDQPLYMSSKALDYVS